MKNPFRSLELVRGALRRVDELELEARRLREQLDALRSSLQVEPELIDELAEWRRSNPVPAEPLVSVCVATYNRSELLARRCIPSVLGQTYGNLELIVVGDACTDDTAAAVAGFDDPRLRFTNLEERGVYPEDPQRRWMVAGTKPLNAALASARGDYVTHLDDDDEYLPDRLERLVSFARETAADVVWHPFWWEQADGSWRLHEAGSFSYGQVTTSSVFYRSWFTRIRWDIDAHRLLEPGDWNRFRRFRYVQPSLARYPDPLLRHYRERSRDGSDGGSA